MAIKTFLSSVGVCWLRLNPVAHRKTKIAYNFGLSECSRVTKVKSNLEIQVHQSTADAIY